MIRAINEYEITGLETTLGFCRFVMEHEAFRSGNFDTKFVEKYFKPEALKGEPANDEMIVAVALSAILQDEKKNKPVLNGTSQESNVSLWKKNRL